MILLYYTALLPLFVARAASQSLVTTLQGQPGLTNFTSYIGHYPNLLAQLNSGNRTVLVPTDDAFATLLGTGANSSADDLEALLQYHCLQGVHPVVTFNSNPQFIPTLLENPIYANVTGGQVVEVTADNGTVSIFTALKAESKVTRADNFFSGGLFQVIDTVLSIPVSGPATITSAGLNDLIALLNLGGLLADPTITDLVLNSKDLTMLGPNNANYSTSWGGLQGLDMADIIKIFSYNLISGTVVYSDMFTNGTKFMTLEGENVTVTVLGNDTYFNAAKVITRDYITSNGVLQVMDKPNNPNNTDARPVSSSTTSSSQSSSGGSGLSTGAKAGIAVGVVVSVLGLAAILFLLWRRRRKNRRAEAESRPVSSSRQQQDHHEPTFEELKAGIAAAEPHPHEHPSQAKELEGTRIQELDGTVSPRVSAGPPPPVYRIQSSETQNTHELDGRETPRQGMHSRETSELHGGDMMKTGLVSPDLDGRFSPDEERGVSPEMERTVSPELDGRFSPETERAVSSHGVGAGGREKI